MKPCPLCSQKVKGLAQHLIDHIDKEQSLEMLHYQKGNEAKAAYRKLFKKEP